MWAGWGQPLQGLAVRTLDSEERAAGALGSACVSGSSCAMFLAPSQLRPSHRLFPPPGTQEPQA